MSRILLTREQWKRYVAHVDKAYACMRLGNSAWIWWREPHRWMPHVQCAQAVFDNIKKGGEIYNNEDPSDGRVRRSINRVGLAIGLVSLGMRCLGERYSTLRTWWWRIDFAYYTVDTVLVVRWHVSRFRGYMGSERKKSAEQVLKGTARALSYVRRILEMRGLFPLHCKRMGVVGATISVGVRFWAGK